MNGHRPPSHVPTAYRPCNNPAVCSSFVLHPTFAIGTVGILTTFTDGLWSLSVYPSARATLMHLASDYIHPTPRGERCRIRIFLPEEEQDAPRSHLLGAAQQRGHVRHLHRGAAGRRGDPLPQVAYSSSVDRALG